MATARLYGQARAFLRHPSLFAQAQARIKKTSRLYGQARAVITFPTLKAQAQAVIRTPRIYLRDTFTRFESNSWGIPEIGPVYTYNDIEAEAAFNVDGSYGTINNLTDFSPGAISAIDAFNQNIFLKLRKINSNNTTIEIISRQISDEVASASDSVIITINDALDTDIAIQTNYEDTPPDTILDNDISWRVQDLVFTGWPSEYEFLPEELGVFGLFTGDRFWYLSTVGTTGTVEPNWSDPQPIIDGTAQWTEIVPTTWAISTGYTAGDYVKPTVFNGNLYKADNSGTTDSTQPSPWPFAQSFNDFSNVDGSIFWQGNGLYDTVWNAVQSYTLGLTGFFGGIYWSVTTAGTSGVSEPNWANPSPITDGTVIWTAIPAWTLTTAFAQNAWVRPTVDNGYIYYAFRAGTTGATQPSPWAVFVEHSFSDGDSTTSIIQGAEDNSTIYYVRINILDDTIDAKFWSSDVDEPSTFDISFNPLLTISPGAFELRIQMLNATDLNESAFIIVDEINIEDPTVLAGRLVAQAAARIRNDNTKLSAQAQAVIRKSQLYGQAQASITNVKRVSGQARAVINNPSTPIVPVIITPSNSINAGIISQTDIANLGLPGYLQSEALISDMQIEQFISTYSDSSRSDYTGLSNKELTITMRIWDIDWETCKNRLELAATMLRARRNGPLNLFIYEQDKYYQVWIKEIRYEKTVPESQRFLDYTVSFEARPWLESITENTITTAGDVSTVGRTYDDGGWTPVNLVVSGSFVSITGTTADGTDAGHIGITGVVTNMVINTESGYAILDGVVRNDLINADFSLYVGPGVTNYVITGATSVVMTWRDRWYL